MRIVLTLLFFFVNSTAMAEGAPGMPAGMPNINQQMQLLNQLPPEQREKVMQEMVSGMQKMQTCVTEAGGMEAMQELQQKGTALSAEVERLCKEGKNKEAEKYAMREGKRMMEDKRVIALKKCSESAVKDLQKLYPDPESEDREGDICDGWK